MRELLFRFANWLRGDNTWKYFSEYKVNQFKHPMTIQLRQLQELKEIVKHAWTFEVYKKHWGTEPIIENLKDLKKLPPISKKDFKGYTFEGIKDSTSGSTGEPFNFWLDKESIQRKKARGRLSYDIAGLNMDDKFVVLWGLSHYDSWKGKIYRKFIQRTMDLSAFDMDEKTMFNYILALNKFQPKVIQAYTSAIYALAQYMKKNSIILSFQPYSVVTSGETLTHAQRELIKERFKCRVINRYGSREFGCIAEECEYESMHIMEDFIIENFNGELLITDLRNKAMPFIRYRIGDMGALSSSLCPCGRGLPILGTVKGRVSEYIVSPSGKILSLHFLTLLFQEHSEIKQFQVIQKSKDSLELLLVPQNHLSGEEIMQIREELNKEINMKINVSIVDEVELTKEGKRRLIIVKNDQ